MNKTLTLLLAVGFVAVSDIRAELVVYGTGLAGPGNRDAHWDVVAVPTDWGGAPTLPYDAYIFQTGAGGWYGPSQPWDNPQNGYTNSDGHFYWIGLQPSADSVFPFPTVWHWIVAQDFTVTEAGNYDISFPAFSDELLDVFINGSVTPAALMPTITGGTRITSGIGPPANGVNFGGLTTVSTSAYLNAGVNTVYAQVRDSGFSTGLMLGDFSFTPAAGVPEPGTWAAAALLVGGAAFMRWRKRARVS